MNNSDGVTLTLSYTKYKRDTITHAIIAIPTVVGLTIEFNEQYLYDDALKLRKIDPEWGKAQEHYYKDFTIKEIYVYIPEME